MSSPTTTLEFYDWSVSLHSEHEKFDEAVEKYLDYFRKSLSPKVMTKKHAFSLSVRPASASQVLGKIEQDPWYSNAQVPIYRKIDPHNQCVEVMEAAGDRMKVFGIYHMAFIEPLSLMIRANGATLMHAALVGSDDRGVLIVGRKRAGKSSFTLSCLSRGFTYFSEEHPLLQWQDGHVVGRGFPNPIALLPESAERFVDWKRDFEWVPNRGKFILPVSVFDSRLGTQCTVDTIVFPRFEAATKLSARRLTPLECFSCLVQDDYYDLNLRTESTSKCSHTQLDIFQYLSHNARSYEVVYSDSELPQVPDFLRTLNDSK